MNYYMIAQTVALIFLWSDFPTTIQFPEKVTFFTLGNQGSFITNLSENGTILVLKPQHEDFEVPMVVITEKSNYQFLLKSSKERFQNFVNIQQGKKASVFQQRGRTPFGILKESDTSLLLERTVESSLKINGQVLQGRRIEFSKSPSTLIEGEIF